MIMKKSVSLHSLAVASTVANYLASGIFCILCILTFLLNVTSHWELWQFVGFVCLGFFIVSAATHIPALILSIKSSKKTLIILNFVSLAVCIVAMLFTHFISAEYGIFK